MKLENLSRRKNRVMPSKRLGRGVGSGVGGHTVGRGQKGQKSRTGHKSTVFFEGGQVPLFRRLPKFRGFKKSDKIEFQTVNIADLEKDFKADEIVSLDSLREKGLVRKRSTHVKILGVGDLKKKLNVVSLPLSESAREKILKAGGTIK